MAIDMDKITGLTNFYAEKWQHLGRVDGPNGFAVLHQPEETPLAYGIRVYKPEPAEEFERFIARESYMFIPEDYRKFLKVYSGLGFHRRIGLYGIVNRMRRDPTDPVGQAFTLAELRFKKINNPTREGRFLFFGSIANYSKSARFAMYEDGFIELWDVESQRLLNEWPSLDAMLEEEMARVDACCDDKGIIRDDVKFLDEGLN